ncbi:MAG: serine/threonine protein phosphatase [Bdellovibrionales bacterium]|nr:serine/threonine protein phosphatase [Bdellovibrionales bacterium]
MSEEPKSHKYLEQDATPERLFVIGDIHGCVSELVLLLEYLTGELDFSDRDHLIFIGDYIDRGPASKEVIDVLMSFQSHHPESVFFLKGNHEDMFLSYLGFEGNLGAGYLANGGIACLESYGFGKGVSPEKIRENLPQNHLDFYQNLNRYIIYDRFVFVHAGLNPLRDLRFQLDEDLFWIRDEFISNMHYFKKTIVFGHTPFEDVMFHLPYKIGLDTGLVYGNMLTCLEVIGESIYQIGVGDAEVSGSSFLHKGGKWPQYG